MVIVPVITIVNGVNNEQVGRIIQFALDNPRKISFLSFQPVSFTGRDEEITPERRALLNTIRFSEGTWARGEDVGYRIMFGGGLMASLERHPDRVNYSGGYASAAAGAEPSGTKTSASGRENFIGIRRVLTADSTDLPDDG